MVKATIQARRHGATGNLILLGAVVLVMNMQPAMGQERKAFFEGAQGRLLERSLFKGDFSRYKRDGAPGGTADADRKISQPEDSERRPTLEEEMKGMRWRRVDPSGEQVEVDLPADVVKRLLEANYAPGQTEIPELSQTKMPEGEDGGLKSEKVQAKPDRFLATRQKRDAAAAEKGQSTEVRGRNGTASAILGADTRWEVATANWRPTQHSGLLTFNGGSCSGSLIGPRHVLTAGHCVHQGNGGDWYSNFRFYPGRSSAGGVAPYGSYTWRRAWTYTGWTTSGDSDHDFALIELTSSPGIGWLSFGWSSGLSTSWYVYHKGYSGDKPFGSQWSTSDYISNVWTNRFYTDSSDTVGGNSGGPWYRYVSGNPVVYGPHSGWNQYWYWFGAKKNRHTRITSTKFASLCDWIDDASVC